MRYKAVLLAMLLMLANCAVAPVLESPRIKPGVKLEFDNIKMQNEMKWHLTDSVMRGGVRSNDLKTMFGGDWEIAPKLKFGFSNKVEVGGYLWWLLLNSGWEGTFKINILDKGHCVIFRNIAIALVAGSRGSIGEWNQSGRNWAGITVGTLQKTGSIEIEYIIMPTFGRNHFTSFDDGLGTGAASFSDILITTGSSIILSQRLYLSFAVLFSSYQYDFSYYHQEQMAEQKTKIDKVNCIPGKIGLNFNIGWRFGKRREQQ